MSKSPLSKCMGRIQESPTLAITAKALKLKSEGKDIIGLAAGEPDFDTPDFIKEAAIGAIKSGKTIFGVAMKILNFITAYMQSFRILIFSNI